MRRAKSALASRNDVCVFCSSKIWAGLRTTQPRSPVYRRQFQSSTSSSRPPAAAAVAKEEDEEPRPEFEQQTSRPPPLPKPQRGGAAWTKPAFGGNSSQLVADSGQAPSIRKAPSVFETPRASADNGASSTLHHPSQPMGSGGASSTYSRASNRPAQGFGQRQPQGEFSFRPIPLNRASGGDREGFPSFGRDNNTTRMGARFDATSLPSPNYPSSVYNSGTVSGHEPRSGTYPEPYRLGQERRMDSTQTREPPAQPSYRPSSRGMESSSSLGQGLRIRRLVPNTPIATRKPDYDSRQSQGFEKREQTNKDPTLGLENGWQHLRHTPAKRYRIEQEKREEQSKIGAWTGFLGTFGPTPEPTSPRASAKSEADNSAEELTSFRPLSEPKEEISGRRARTTSIESDDTKFENALSEDPLIAKLPEKSAVSAERLEDARRWERKKSRRAEKYVDGDEDDDLDAAGPRKSGRSSFHRRIAAGRYEEKDDEDFDDEHEFKEAKATRKEILQIKAERKRQRELEAGTPISLPDFISVINLANLMRKKPEAFMDKLDDLGFHDVTHDHILDSETAGLIATEFSFYPRVDEPMTMDLVAQAPVEDQSTLPQRPPVVTIMGHVDHGKTTILDFLRKSSVVASEFGGITQHIGAFSVPMPSGKLITFLDTPGHAAFLEMRRRGANMTDIVILVVAADDSVKPQTVEAIKHIKGANVATIVAINKIDKEDANAERVKQDLAREGIAVEDYGGDIQAVTISGKTGQGIPDLEEAAVALSEQLDRRADPSGFAEGWVVEATTKVVGRVATVLVRRGTLRPGNIIVAGTTWARVKTLKNEAGASVSFAGPGTPVEVDGWKEQPIAGDEVLQAPSESRAKSAIDFRLEQRERAHLMTDISAINETRRFADAEREKLKGAERIAQEKEERRIRRTHEEGWRENENRSGIKEVFFIVKADVSGSVEAVVNSVAALGNAEVRAHVLRSGVGPISAFDIEHAAAAEGHILNFNTTIDPNIQRLAEMEEVEIFDHNIIYKLVDAVKSKLSEQLEPLVIKKVTGEAEIGKIFDISVKGKEKMAVAGCRIRNGVIARTSKVRVLRDREIIYDGTLSSLKNIKKDVAEMRKGTECGLSFEGWHDFVVDDQVQCYDETREKRFLE